MATSKTNPKRFWKYASTHKPGGQMVTEVVCNGIQLDKPPKIADALNHQFMSEFTPTDTAPTPPHN